eukprot:CAMPEP_0203748920 /NCGR_PEP_ID=MMETSP0098-20131031/3669_1 /ASSEMBLY_ACC=CAM_ASM_000208 /TAXON_ID=96639 /ORGANISM=" , Strain NY0313808BC1" /LENGTH=539 /DNA_ID=CAMNT_0050637837 /DNA_START=2029 /DNA_END=3645 /DNA_ORIENTATION=-
MATNIKILALIATVIATALIFRFAQQDTVQPLRQPWEGTAVLEVEPTLLDQPAFDLRVSKAMGTRGYNKVRVSAITEGGLQLKDELFTYKKPFQNRWMHAYDLGQNGLGCKEDGALKVLQNIKHEAACSLECGKQPGCTQYSYFAHAKKCVLSDDSCVPSKMAGASGTYGNHGRRMLHSGIVEVTPGVPKKLRISGVDISLSIPKEDGATGGIVWADPCSHSKWITCDDGERFKSFYRSYELMNNLAEHDTAFDFFQILGDNFYDQDGRITREMYAKFSNKLKSKILQTVPGNHDLWVGGGPKGDQYYDQYGHGFMQFYAQDTIAAQGNELFNMSIMPDGTTQGHNSVRNSNSNFFFYHKIGNLGFIGYNGVGGKAETDEWLKTACKYFAKGKRPASIFLLQHFNTQEGYLDKGMSSKQVRKRVLKFEGCDIGDRLKYIMGHQHCNYIDEHGEAEPVGFLMGAHGMHNDAPGQPVCNQDGFMYIRTTDSYLTVYYFENSNFDVKTGKTVDNYDKIIKCIGENGGLSNCVEHGKVWVNSS